ncbi:MAG: hypothetical protein WDM76_10545 [Limisphaerales bacterium]
MANDKIGRANFALDRMITVVKVGSKSALAANELGGLPVAPAMTFARQTENIWKRKTINVFLL